MHSLRARLGYSHPKSCGYHWKLDIVLNFQELAWEAQSQTTPAKRQRYRPAPEAVTHARRVQRSCVGVKEQELTLTDICAVRWDLGEDLPSLLSFQ